MSPSSINEKELRKIVEQVVMRMNSSTPANTVDRSGYNTLKGNLGLFSSADSAFDAAELAYHQLSEMSLKKRGELIENFRAACRKEVESLAKTAHEETGYGRIEDKIQKNILAIEKTPGIEDIKGEVFTGDHGMTLVERGPFGIIAAITPSTNPSATVINNAISMVAAGNTVVFNCHPSAKKSSLRVIEIFNEVAVKCGAPLNIITGIAEPNIDTSRQVMNHKKARIVVVTGGEVVVKEAFKTGKKVMAAGPGNPPAVVDETADIEKAGRDIVSGATFDNGVLCTAEKEVIAVSSIADRLKEVMVQNGAYEINAEELNRLEKVIFNSNGGPARKFIGKNASVILAEIGIKVDENTRMVLCETGQNHPLVTTEMLMPVVPLVRVPDIDTAIELACEVENYNLHTATMHSKNIENLHKMARKIKTSIFVKNAPSYCGLGYLGEGPATLTICTPTGEGITTAKSFTRRRSCALVDYFRII